MTATPSMPAAHPPSTDRSSSRAAGILPYIGVILFVIHIGGMLLAGPPADFGRQVVMFGVFYMIGISGVGAGISHIFFGPRIARSIGWEWSPFETEVGFANLGFGLAGLMATSFGPAFWLAVIIANGVFRVGAGVGHIREMITRHNYAINNTAILFINFVVPAFLLAGWYAWT